jgi:hypothetical protein
MSTLPAALWPWLAIAGLGLFHGLNPAMGWLFAVALGLNRHSERIVWLSLVPIAIGHAVAVAAVLAAFLLLGLVVSGTVLMRVAGVVLLAWAAWHALYGHRQRVRVGMQTGLTGLALWSFLMANAHGAGLMLIPAVMPLCVSGTPGADLITQASAERVGSVALAALGLHTAAMLATIAVIALAVYRWIGVGFLRRGWINLDLLWTAALALCGMVLLVVS